MNGRPLLRVRGRWTGQEELAGIQDSAIQGQCKTFHGKGPLETRVEPQCLVTLGR
jgi:hypothetical protein